MLGEGCNVFKQPYITAKKDWLFNLWMVTLVADKLRRQWLWEVCVGIGANCISYLSPNRTLKLTAWTSVRESLQLHFKNAHKSWDSHRSSVVTISARSWLLLHACFLIHVIKKFLPIHSTYSVHWLLMALHVINNHDGAWLEVYMAKPV